MPLDEDKIQRFSRQLVLKNWSAVKQATLANLTVIVSDDLPSAAIYLAATGVESICLGPQFDTFLLEHLRLFNPELKLQLVEANQIGSIEKKFDWAIISEQFKASSPVDIADQEIVIPSKNFSVDSLELGCSAVSYIINSVNTGCPGLVSTNNV